MAVALWVWVGGPIAVIASVLAVFVLQFFRDPPRQVTAAPGTVVAPADGRVIAVLPLTDPWRGCPAIKVSIFMNVFNVHSNRSPVDGAVTAVSYHPGRFINANFDKASLHNERNALVFRTEGGATITCVQVAGLIARRILCYVKVGDQLKRGERYGFIRFGSRVDLYLPPESRILVSIGDTVSAACTSIAVL